MVYIHFPQNLTEEELMLQNKYQKLKKKVVVLFINAFENLTKLIFKQIFSFFLEKSIASS